MGIRNADLNSVMQKTRQDPIRIAVQIKVNCFEGRQNNSEQIKEIKWTQERVAA